MVEMNFPKSSTVRPETASFWVLQLGGKTASGLIRVIMLSPRRRVSVVGCIFILVRFFNGADAWGVVLLESEDFGGVISLSPLR